MRIASALALLPGSVASPQDVPALRLVESLKVLGADLDISANISRLAVGRDGRMAVFNDPNGELVFFDSAGKKLGTFGGKGQGPGEFSGGSSGQLFFINLGFTADTLWAYEGAQRRFTLISPDLKLVRAPSLPQFDAATVGAFTPLSMLGGGRLLGQVMIGRPVPYEMGGVTRTWYEPSDSAIVIGTPDGKIEKRVATLPSNRSSSIINRPGRMEARPVPFATAPLRDVSRSGDQFVYVTHAVSTPTGGTYRVSVIRAEGDTVWTRSYPFNGQVITQRMKDSVVDGMIARSNAPGRGGRAPVPVPEEHLKFFRENMPSVRAPFTAVLLGIDGTVWLRRYAAQGEVGQYLVLDDRGAALGSVSLPRTGLQVHEVSRTSLWTTERDADGFLNVVRYRVEGARE